MFFEVANGQRLQIRSFSILYCSINFNSYTNSFKEVYGINKHTSLLIVIKRIKLFFMNLFNEGGLLKKLRLKLLKTKTPYYF